MKKAIVYLCILLLLPVPVQANQPNQPRNHQNYNRLTEANESNIQPIVTLSENHPYVVKAEKNKRKKKAKKAVKRLLKGAAIGGAVVAAAYIGAFIVLASAFIYTKDSQHRR